MTYNVEVYDVFVLFYSLVRPFFIDETKAMVWHF